MTYLIAARAGFPPAEAALVAQAAQEIDDNHIPIAVNAGAQDNYLSAITQTMNILQPHHTRKVYPIFHFIPGDPDAPSTRRKDRLRSGWVTTPNSPLANALIDTALRSKNLYRIGASAHAFADSWAHQNFVGGSDVYNEMPGVSMAKRVEDDIALLRIGHALAGHQPDIPALIWTDERLVRLPRSDNTDRFHGRGLPPLPQILRIPSMDRRTGKRLRGAAASASLLKDLRADYRPPRAHRNCVRCDPDAHSSVTACARSIRPMVGIADAQTMSRRAGSDEAFVEKHAGGRKRRSPSSSASTQGSPATCSNSARACSIRGRIRCGISRHAVSLPGSGEIASR